jgi:hypothetical protein
LGRRGGYSDIQLRISFAFFKVAKLGKWATAGCLREDLGLAMLPILFQDYNKTIKTSTPQTIERLDFTFRESNFQERFLCRLTLKI